MPTITKVVYYRDRGVWCYAADDAEGFDHSDTLDAASAAEARSELVRRFPGAVVERVANTTEEN